MRKAMLAGAGGVLAALLGALCCAGPLLFVTLGVGAGLASTFEPLRPVFGVVMLGLFGLAFASVYGRRAARTAVGPTGASIGGGGESGGGSCATDTACAVPRDRRREQVILWLAAVLALVLWTFPTWSRLLV
ncbi:MAG: mercuric transporter MerT family protein [Gemmatimonadota bacterium]